MKTKKTYVITFSHRRNVGGNSVFYTTSISKKNALINLKRKFDDVKIKTFLIHEIKWRS